MKILLYANTFAQITNGPAKFANALYRASQNAADIDLQILTESPLLTPLPKVQQVAAASWRTRLRLPLGKLKFSFHHHHTIQQFLAEKPQWQPDFVIFNDGCSGLYSSLRGVGDSKIVLMVNDDDYASSHRKGWWKTRQFRVFYYHFYLEQLACQKADIVFADSIYIKQLLEKVYGLPAAKVLLSYQGVQEQIIEEEIAATDSFPRSVAATHPIRIVFTKSDPIRGGLQELVAALSQLTAYYFELTIIGPFQDPIQLLGLSVPPHLQVRYLGPTAQPIVFEQIRQHHIFCTPSRREASGIASMEALALGTTVVSTRVGGIPEVLDQGRNGYLASACSAAAIAKALKACITDSPENRQAKRLAGKNWAKQHFNQTRLVAEFFSLLRERLTAKPRV